MSLDVFNSDKCIDHLHLTGKELPRKSNLTCSNENECKSSYDPNVDAVTLNEFTTGIMRTLHKYIPNNLTTYDKNFDKIETISVSDTVLNMKLVNDYYVELMRGMLVDEVDVMQAGYSFEIRNKLFKDEFGNGFDLDVVDTMRLRDSGSPSYVDFVRLFTGKNVKSWTDLKEFFTPQSIELLKKIFVHPDNVDIKYGAVLERKDKYGAVGIIKANILVEQFKNLQLGDRFFYTNNRYTKGFSQ